MISFECDYNNGAHPTVLKRLLETNDKQSLTYGYDEWSDSAKAKIREACDCEDAEIFFLTGGTQANETVIDGTLELYQGVIACESGHINVHEAGAVEFSGHKIIALPSHDGKLWASDLESYMDWFIHDESNMHLAQPGMVYITFPTEYGTLYTGKEIGEIYEICKRYDLKLFIDGARMGYGLAASDITLPFIASHCDVFYIGGTKVGALCGEAIVYTSKSIVPKHFFTIIKQHGALVAKGRLIGLQFDALFTDRLYLEISKHAIDLAMRVKKMFIDHGYKLFIDSPTNQQFVIIPNDKMHILEKDLIFTHWQPFDEKSTVCRFVTSWATTEEQTVFLEEKINRLA